MMNKSREYLRDLDFDFKIRWTLKAYNIITIIKILKFITAV